MMTKIRKLYNSKAFIFVVTFLVSFFIWYYYSVVVNPNTTITIKNIPIEVNMTDSVPALKGLTIIEQGKLTVDVKLSCSRYESIKIKNKIIKASVDVSTVTNPGSYTLPINISIDKSALSTDVNIVEKSSSYLALTFDETISKFIPVETEVLGNVDNKYILGDPILDITSINVSGPKTIVNKIESALATYDVTNQTETKVYNCKLKLLDTDKKVFDSELIITSSDSVSVSVPLYITKTVDVSLNLISSSTNGHAVSLVQPVLSPSTVTLKGTVEVMDKIDTLSIGDIDFSSITENYSKDFDLILPQGVTSEDNTTKINAKINISSLSTKTIIVDSKNIAIRNSNNSISIANDKIEVTIFGNYKVLNSITSVDAYINLENKSLPKGKRTVPMYISLNSYETADVLFKYSVVITVR